MQLHYISHRHGCETTGSMQNLYAEPLKWFLWSISSGLGRVSFLSLSPSLPSFFFLLSVFLCLCLVLCIIIYNIINIANSQMPLIVASNLSFVSRSDLCWNWSDTRLCQGHLELIGSRFARVTSRSRPVGFFARDWCQTTQTTSSLMSVCLPGCLSPSLSVSVCLFLVSVSIHLSACQLVLTLITYWSQKNT